jgi:hypothetical protein
MVQPSTPSAPILILKLDLLALIPYCHACGACRVYPVNPGDHSPDKLRATFQKSLDTLGPNIKPRVFYLHAPDRSVPFEDTVAAV